MPLSYALTTYPSLKAWSGLSDLDPISAGEMIDAATVAIEKYCRRPLVIRAFSEFSREGGCKRLHLNQAPIVSVTSIQDGQTPPTTVASTEYDVWPEWLEHHTYWPTPVYRWTIGYTAGLFASVDAVEEAARQACNTLANLLYQAPRKPHVSIGRDERNEVYRIIEKGELPGEVALLVDNYVRTSVGW